MATANSSRPARHRARSDTNRPRTQRSRASASSSARASPTKDGDAAEQAVATIRSAKNKKGVKKPPDMEEILEGILGHFSDKLAIIETAYRALQADMDDEEATKVSDCAPAVETLRVGIREIRHVYSELDLAILRH